MLLWIGGSGGLGAYFWGTWWCVPFFAVYGVLYGSGSRRAAGTECGHGTAFKTQWKNEAVYQLACFFMIRNPVTGARRHSRHHTDTIIVGRDPEIITMPHPELAKVLANFFGLVDARNRSPRCCNENSCTDAEKDYIPQNEWARRTVARIWTAGFMRSSSSCDRDAIDPAAPC